MNEGHEKHKSDSVKNPIAKKYWAYGFLYGGFLFILLAHLYGLRCREPEGLVLFVVSFMGLIGYIVYVLINRLLFKQMIPRKMLHSVEILLIISMVCSLFAYGFIL